MLNLFKSVKFYILILSVITIGATTLLIADSLFMPWYTKYNQGVTIPDVTKMSLEDAEELLVSYGLRHVVADKRSHDSFPPNYIIDQSPVGSTIVKPGRKVFLTVSATERPMVIVPDLVNLSFQNARIQLQNHGLRDGNVSFESSPFRNAVLKQSIPAGRSVDRGAMIDLVIGDGLGQKKVKIPHIIGLNLPEAQRLLRDAGLRVGIITFHTSIDYDPNMIMSFTPADRDSIFEGDVLDLVISEKPNLTEESESGTLMEEGMERRSLETRVDTLKPIDPIIDQHPDFDVKF